MKTTSKIIKKTGQRMRFLLSAVLAVLLVFMPFIGCIPASAESDAQYNANMFARITQPKIKYKIEITSESQASGWNSASVKVGYRGDGGKTDRQSWDIKDDISNGRTITKEFSLPKDDVPSVLRLYLDFGGGFTIRSHSGRIKFYADGEEVMNEPYSARSYPFNSSDETLDFQIDGIAPTIVESPDGSTEVYSSVKKAWSKAKDKNGSKIILWENSYVRGTLEVKNNITLDLNGFFFGNTEVGTLFDIKNGGSLTLTDSDPKRDTGENYICTLGMTDEKDADSRTFHLTGGGIYHGGTMEGSIINVEKGGSLSVNGCTFTDCHTGEGSGGAIYCEGSLNLEGTRFINCTALKGNGGAVCIAGEPNVSLENLRFDRCAAENGGAISFENDKTPGTLNKFKGCIFNNCHADEYGGAYYNIGRCSIDADALTFSNCSAKYGGGFYIASGGSQFDSTVYPNSVRNSKFENCSATESGGGVGYYNAAELTLDTVEFNGCSSGEDGGAIHLLTLLANGRNDFFQHDIRINNCDIHHCSAKDEGGAICVYDELSTEVRNDTIIYNSSVHDNTAKTGGGIYVESIYVYLVNSTVTNNKAESKYGGGVYVDSMYDIELGDEVVIRDNTANGKTNNLCLQNGVFSSAKIYCGGLYDGSYIGVSSTSTGSSTVASNISQFQVSKFLKPDNSDYGLSMTNTKDVETKLYASMISQNVSLAIIIGGVAVIISVICILYFKKRGKEGKNNDGQSDN